MYGREANLASGMVRLVCMYRWDGRAEKVVRTTWLGGLTLPSTEYCWVY